MAKYSFFAEEPPQPLDNIIYIPDENLYKGLSFLSYPKMMAMCSRLEKEQENHDKEAYTPYRVKYFKKV